jgi:hypothetical protein
MSSARTLAAMSSTRMRATVVSAAAAIRVHKHARSVAWLRLNLVPSLLHDGAVDQKLRDATTLFKAVLSLRCGPSPSSAHCSPVPISKTSLPASRLLLMMMGDFDAVLSLNDSN